MAVKSFLFLADFVKAILVNLLIMTQLDARLVLKVFALYVFDGTLKRSPFSFFVFFLFFLTSCVQHVSFSHLFVLCVSVCF